MEHVRLEDIEASVADLVARVEGGETVVFTRGGEPVARIEAVISVPKKPKPIDFEALEELTHGMTYQEESAGDFMRRMRDGARY